MFRLKEQQLHMLMWMMAIASVLLFCVFGIGKAFVTEKARSLKGMEDFSEGWVCTYETSDEGKLAEYRRKNEIPEEESKDSAESVNMIAEVLMLPETLSVKEDTNVILTRRVPEMKQDTVYVTMKLDNASIKVSVEGDIIYSGSEKEKMLPVRHVIPVAAKYSDSIMTIEISGLTDEEFTVEKLQVGNYNQLWMSVWQTQGVTIGIGFVLLVIGLAMVIAWLVIRNTWQQKRVLLYTGVEGIALGALFLLGSDVLPLLTGWNYGVYLLKACVVIMSIVLHLTLIRCFIYKKKVLGIVDTTILFVGVFYISAMVLQWFGLMHFDIIYNIAVVLYAIVMVLFTIIPAITIFRYQRREGLPVFVANVLLILCMLIQLILYMAGRQPEIENLYVNIGFLIYVLYIGIHGMRQATYVQAKTEEQTLDEQRIRTALVEEMNPNLLFVSFKTLQNLIKSGSAMSVKMIYYISVYFRDNLRAIENAGEMVSFDEELEHMIAYLQLQKTRNQNMDFSIECKVKDFNIPRHSLEPLVENAVRHGLAGNGNKGNIVIRTYTRADGYAVQIIDDGAGFDTRILKNKSTSIAKSLDLLETICQARTEVVSKEGKGTVITIVLPMLDNELMEEIE